MHWQLLLVQFKILDVDGSTALREAFRFLVHVSRHICGKSLRFLNVLLFQHGVLMLALRFIIYFFLRSNCINLRLVQLLVSWLLTIIDGDIVFWSYHRHSLFFTELTKVVCVCLCFAILHIWVLHCRLSIFIWFDDWWLGRLDTVHASDSLVHTKIMRLIYRCFKYFKLIIGQSIYSSLLLAIIMRFGQPDFDIVILYFLLH